MGNASPSDWNEYFLGTGTHVAITDTTTKGNQLIGQVVFRHGRTSGLDSGAIVDKPNAWSYACFPGSCIMYNTVQVNLTSDHGDSGAGFYRLSTAGGGTTRSAYGVLSGGGSGGDADTYYYAWNQPFYSSTAFCDLWIVQPCTSNGCPLS